MEMKVRFEGKKQVVAEFEGFRVITDQPPENGGEGKAPAPFDLFLASIATCAGFFVQAFCEKRGISAQNVEVTQTADWDEAKHLYTKIRIDIRLPSEFPEKYRESLVNSVNLCSVKKHIQNAPQFEVSTFIS